MAAAAKTKKATPARKPAKKKVEKVIVPPFQDAEIEKKWDDGYTLVRIRTKEDMRILGNHGGGCSGTHYHWTDHVDPPCEYFFVMMNPKGEIGKIYFCKDARWFGIQYTPDKPIKKREKNTNPDDYYANDPYYQDTRHGNPPACKAEQPCGGREHGSSAYDGGWVRGAVPQYGDYEKDEARYQLREAEYRYERIKARAVQMHGALGKDHPMKHEVDAANKQIQACKAHLATFKISERVRTGEVFRYRDVELFFVQIVGRYGVNNTPETRYSERMEEWIAEQEV